MRSADNGSYISFVHVSPSGLTGNMNGEGEAQTEVSEMFRAMFTTCSDTSFERETRFSNNETSFVIKIM